MESQESSPSSDATPVDALRDDPSLLSRGLEVEDVLGQGGSSIVYRARDIRHGREVAIKVLRQYPALENAVDRFTQEIRVAAGLRHAHMLPLFDSGTLRDGRLFSVMPVAQGRPLSALIREGPLTVADTVRLAREIAQALAHLHRSGYVHRDVKPENVLVESGHAVLTDFGLAASLGALAMPGESPPGTAWWKTAVGTLPYMSPEALFADGLIDGRTDIYALGIVLYEMLAAELPFVVTSAEQLLARRTRDGQPSIRALRADVPRELEAIIARSTALEPGDRFESADAMDAALAQVPAGVSGSSLVAFSVNQRTLSIGLVALLVGSVIGVSAWHRARQASTLDPQRIVVVDLVNDTGDSALAGVGVLAGDFITEDLTARSHLSVVNATIALPSRQQRRLPPADSTLARQTRALVASTRAGLAVTGAYFRAGNDLEVVAEVTDTRSGRVIGVAGPVHGALDHPDSSLRVLGDSVVAILRRRHAPPG